MKNLLIILSLAAVIGSVFYFSSQPNKSDLEYSEQLKKDVQKYLINEKGYAKDDIVEIKIIDNIKLKGEKRFEIAVVFKDDKDSEYYYDYDKSGNVQQLAATGTKHAK